MEIFYACSNLVAKFTVLGKATIENFLNSAQPIFHEHMITSSYRNLGPFFSRKMRAPLCLKSMESDNHLSIWKHF